MKLKLLTRLFCALLSVLMLVCAVPAITVSAASSGSGIDVNVDYTKVKYDSVEDRLAAMEKMLENDQYELYCDKLLGVVAYRKKATGEVLFSNPWDMSSETAHDAGNRQKLLSQIVLTYRNSEGVEKTLNSYYDAALKGQLSVQAIKNGIRVEYAIGERSARVLLPEVIEKEAFETKILEPLKAALGENSRAYKNFKNWYTLIKYPSLSMKPELRDPLLEQYPVFKEKEVDIYVLQVDNMTLSDMREQESLILEYCPNYTFDEMDDDHDYVNHSTEAKSPAVFRMALEYKLDGNGLTATLPANGIYYDESSYRILSLQILPFMGASKKSNEGYSFIPDGSGTLYSLSQDVPTTSKRVYGEDFAMFSNISGEHSEPIRMPVFGQVETLDNGDGTTTKRGYLAIIEEGESLASIAPYHRPSTVMQYTSVIPSFVIRPTDYTASDWQVFACRRYADDYKIRYMMLSDDTKAQQANLSSYYECSWMGMAFAYRDYLAATKEGFERLTAADVTKDIPLYIETFGCMDTVKRVLSMPVTVSVALTSFEDIRTMYDYLAGEGVANVNFKLKGYANGGLYSDVPYKLKWERSVGGSSGFEELVEYAAEKGFGIFPDFDFVYTTQSDGGNAVSMKKNAARTIDNRYTSRRVYSATKQTLVSYYQMVLSPATYQKFYEKLGKKYEKYEAATGISLATLGNSLNSDFDEDKTVLREEAKSYVLETLSYFKQKNYDIMLDSGNAFTWGYADHILNVPLDSSRYTVELTAVPFMGVVLHGYVEFAGSALNMEGDLSYAMLKAIENGASAYFVLSYANTELLKEDPVLSQNYSVRYDIWQERLVSIYKELNAVLADVQTKLIIDHQILNSEQYSQRVPDERELLEDIEKRAEQAAKELEAKIEAERLEKIEKADNARKDAINAAALIVADKATYLTNYELLNNLRASLGTTDSEKALRELWKTCREAAQLTTQQKNNLSKAFNQYVILPYVALNEALKDAEARMNAAQNGYDYLVSVKDEQGLQQSVLDEAKAGLDSAIAEYELLLKECGGTEVDVSTLGKAELEDFLFGTTDNYTGVSAKSLYDMFVKLLVEDGFYDPANAAASVVNVDALLAAAMPTPEQGSTPTTNKSNYAVDNNIVLVTYGDQPGDPYKSFLLNFNDYTVQVTYNGVIYTIAGYEYVQIYY